MPLTVLGETLAKPGLVFRYDGETDPGCAGCRLRKQCHSNLAPGREYRVTGVRPVKHDCCHVFEGKVQLVEIEERPLALRITIPATATRGTGVSKHWEECGASCLYKSMCNPAALKPGVTAKILQVEGEVPCLVGRKLYFARVDPDG